MEQKAIIAIAIAAVVLIGGGIAAVLLLSNGGDSEPSYSVKYNVNGGDPLDYKSFTKSTETFDLATPTRDGYSFLGWYGNSNLTGDKITQVSKGTEKDIEVWAKWQLILAANTVPTAAQMTANTDVKVTFNNTANDDDKVIGDDVRDALTSGKTLTIEDTSQNITWTFSGSDTKQAGYKNEAFDTAVEATPNLEDKKVVLTFDYDGVLPYQSTVRYLFGVGYAGQDVTAENSRTHELIGPYKVDAQGYVEFPIDHCSDWTITVSYNVVFDAAGGTIDNGTSKTLVIPYKSPVGTLPTAKRTGYTFAAWSPAVTAETLVTDNVTYTATWTENQYTINFDKNNQSATGNMDPMTIGYTETKALPACGFTLTGHSASWNFLQNGTGISIPDGGNITGAAVCESTETLETTLYAKWTPNVYTILFDGEQGTTPAGKNVTYGQAVGALPESTRNGYSLEGWYTQANGAGDKYTEGTIYNVAGGTTLHANWTLAQYNITYILNEGTNAQANPASYTIEDTIQLAAATRNNYAFMGWYLNSDFNGERVTQISQGTTGAITLYARWGANNANVEIRIDGALWDIGNDPVTLTLNQATKAMEKKNSGVYYLETSNEFPISNATYTVKKGNDTIGELIVNEGYGELTVNYYSAHFYANNAEYGDVQAILAGGNVVRPQQDPTKTGYGFSAWTNQGGQAYDFNTGVNATVYLYASFTANTYYVSFDTDGGSLMERIQVNYDADIENIVPPTKQGFGFQGFFLGNIQYFDTAGHPMETSTETTVWKITEDTELTAHWGAMSVSLSFGNIGPALSATYGQPMPVLDPNFYTPGSENGKRFVGYFDAAEGGNKYYNADLSSAVQTSDLVQNTTMYPHYENITYTVVYNLANGQGDVPNDQTVQLGGSFNEPQNAPTKAGYTFVGWSYYEISMVNAFEEGVCNVQSWALRPDATTLTLYAHWEPRSYTIHFDANGGSGQAPADANARTGAQFLAPEFGTTKGEGNNRQFFGGWNTAEDGNGVDYRGTVTFDSTLVTLAGNNNSVTLYVKWVAMEFSPSVGYTFTGMQDNGGDETYDMQMIVIAVGDTTFRVVEKTPYQMEVYEFAIGTYPLMHGFGYDLIEEIMGGTHTTGTFTINGVNKDVDIYSKSCLRNGNTYLYTIKVTADGFVCSVTTEGYGATTTYSYSTHAASNLEPATVTYRSSTPSAEVVRQGVTTFVSAGDLGMTRSGYTCTGWAIDLAVFQPGDAVIGDMVVHAQWQEITNPRTNIEWCIYNPIDGINFLINGQDATRQNAVQGGTMTVEGGAGWTYDSSAHTFQFVRNSITYIMRIAASDHYTVNKDDSNRPVLTFGAPDEYSTLPYYVEIGFSQELPYFGQYDPRNNDQFVYVDSSGTQETLTVTGFNNIRTAYSSSIGTNFAVGPGIYPYPMYTEMYVDYDREYLRGADVIQFNGQEIQVHVLKVIVFEQYYRSNYDKAMGTYVAIEHYIGVNDGLFYRSVFRSYDGYTNTVSVDGDYRLVSVPNDLHVIMQYSATMDYNGGTYNQESTAQVDLTGPSTTMIPAKDGSVFRGWSLTRNGDVRYAYADGAFTPRYFQPEDTRDFAISLFAVWEDEGAQEYTITYVLNRSTIEGKDHTFTADDQSVNLKTVQQLEINSRLYIMYYYMSQSQSWYWPGASVSTSELIQQADEYYTVTIEVYYVDTITVNIGGNYTDSGYMQHYVTNDGQSHDLPSKDDVEERFEEWAFTHTATGFNTRSDGTGTQYNLGAAIGTDGLMQLYDGNTYILYVTWEALPLAQLIVHANNETDDTYEQTIPTNAPYQVPEYEILPWDWEYDGYISVGLSLSANGSNPYGFGRNVPADVLQNAISDGCIHLYCAWSDTAVRGFIYGNFEGAKPEFIAEIVEEGGSLTLPPANAVKGIWDYNGTPLGYSTAEDGDVEYALGANITYAQICAIEGHSLYVIWERDPVQYTVQYYLVDVQSGDTTELTSDTFSDEDDTYTVIDTPQGCDGYLIILDGYDGYFSFGDEVETVVLIENAVETTVSMYIYDPSIFQ